MASNAISFLEIATRSFRESVSCSICWDVYKSPRSLSCLHTFCEDCIQANINAHSVTRRPKSIVCPDCRQPTKPPKNQPPDVWAQHLPRNFALVNLLEKLQESRNFPKTDCDEVGGQKSVNPADLEECRKLELCQVHQDKKIAFYCAVHEALLCQECCETIHNWGCQAVTIESITSDAELSANATELENEMTVISNKLEETAKVMKDGMDDVEKTIEDFPKRLIEIRHEIDLLMNELQIETSKPTFKEEIKSKFTLSHLSKISECQSRQEALRSIQLDMKVVEEYGTPVQRFIAAEQLRRHIPTFQRAADDSATSATRVEIMHDGIEVLASILKMRQEMRIVQGRSVRLMNENQN